MGNNISASFLGHMDEFLCRSWGGRRIRRAWREFRTGWAGRVGRIQRGPHWPLSGGL